MFVFRINNSEFEHSNVEEILNSIIYKCSNEDGYITITNFIKTFREFGIQSIKPIDESLHENFDTYGWFKNNVYDYCICQEISTMSKTLVMPDITFIPIMLATKRPDLVEIDATKTEEFNAVSHPSHYTEGRKYEPRKVISDWGLNFNLGNAVKYISRAGRKGDTIEDLKKAIQYIQFEIEELEEEII